MKMFKAILKDESGQGMVEYGLILGLIAIVAIAVIASLGDQIQSLFSKANTDLAAGLATP